MDFEKPPLFFVWFIPTIIAVWTGIGYLVAVAGGWRRLAEAYPSDEEVDGMMWRFQSAMLGFGANYGGCLTITANDDGLRIATLPFFPPFHPPLFIPWQDISFSRSRVFFVPQITLQFAAHPTLPLHISIRLAKKVQDAIGRRWFEEDQSCCPKLPKNAQTAASCGFRPPRLPWAIGATHRPFSSLSH